MPPWAALECERTGWTLERIPTDAPCSAAARAARWPARPAPITRTSWVGTGRRFYANGFGRTRATGHRPQEQSTQEPQEGPQMGPLTERWHPGVAEQHLS